MLKVAHAKWGQSLDDLREAAMTSSHVRTRERFLAVYEIARENENATSWAAAAARHFQTVHAWVHGYNDRGPEALHFRRTGGRTPLLT